VIGVTVSVDLEPKTAKATQLIADLRACKGFKHELHATDNQAMMYHLARLQYQHGPAVLFEI
jgi:hypothetical protein